MKKTTIFVLAAVLCLCLFSCEERAALAAYVSPDDEEEKHPIDAELEKRLNADPTTVGMMEAYQQTLADWDKLLNKNYNTLMQKLSKEQQAKLRASQREWIKYRDLEFEFRASVYSNMEGTIYLLAPGIFQCNFVKDRALSLGYLLSE